MRSPVTLACLLAATLPALAGCGREHATKMIDPRTGVAAYCYSERFNVFTTASAVQPQQACINELAYYGFRDEAWLKQATTPPPPPAQPMPAPQPLPWLPPESQRGPLPPASAPPVYSGPVNPTY